MTPPELQRRPRDAPAGPNRLPAAIPAVLFGVIAALVTADFVSDVVHGLGPEHVWLDTVVLLVALPGLVLMWRVLRRSEAHARGLSQILEAGLGGAGVGARLASAMDRQLERWRLSVVERDAMLLLLQGASVAGVAAALGVPEARARQLAIRAYRKIRRVELDAGSADEAVRDASRAAVFLLVRLRGANRALMRLRGVALAARRGDASGLDHALSGLKPGDLHGQSELARPAPTPPPLARA